jgi:hypothetical protein
MKFRSLILFCLIALGLFACNKDKYQTKPQISLTSINSLVPVNGDIDAILQFTQKNGRLGQGTFSSIRVRLNQDPLLPGEGNADTVVLPIPDFPDKNQGQFQFTPGYSYLHESGSENDTFLFKFSVVDRVGNKSDTLTTGKVVVLFQ